MMKKICVVPGGGLAPGKTIVMQAVVKECLLNDVQIMGAAGFHGLLHGDIRPLNTEAIPRILNEAVASTRTTLPLPDEAKGLARRCVEHSISSVIIIGGNGTLRVTRHFACNDIQCIFVPATIMNDMEYTDYSIGFDSALNAGLECINRLDDTLPAREICYLVELPNSTQLVSVLSLASDALDVLGESGKICLDTLHERMEHKTHGPYKRHHILFPWGQVPDDYEREILERQFPDIEFRYIAVSHLMNRGKVTAYDSCMAREFGKVAVSYLLKNMESRALGFRCNKIEGFDFSHSLADGPPIRWPIYK